MASGKPFKQWASEISPMLESKGWLGSQTRPAWRLENIFRTNMQSAYAAGQWEQIQAQAEIAPFLMYDAVDDFRTREEHAARDGTIQPVTWIGLKRGWYPPCGWSCRCGVIQLSQDDLDDMDLKVSPTPRLSTYEWKNPRTGKTVRVLMGNDPGFDFNPGLSRAQELKNLANEKAKALPPDLRAAAKKKLAAEPPVDPYAIPPFIRQQTVPAASRDATEFFKARNAQHYPNEADFLPAIRFRHPGARTRSEVVARKLGQGSLAGFDVDTANCVLAWLRDAAVETDRIGIPRLRGVNTAAGRYGGTMGDGVLSITKQSKVTDPSEPLLSQRKRRSEEFLRWQASDGEDNRNRPQVSTEYFTSGRDRLLAVMWHEFAHHIHQTFRVTNALEYRAPILEKRLVEVILRRQGGGPLTLPTRYARTSVKEYFAECYALYKMGKSRLVPDFMLDFIIKVERGELP